MEIFQAIILGIVQGITEFLPISSDGHLILARALFRFRDQGLGFDIFLHLGTLVAIVAYFWRDWLKILKEIRKSTLFWKIVAAIIPAVIAGILLENAVAGYFRSILWTAIFFMLSAIFYILVELWYKKLEKNNNLEKISWFDALAIGIAQIFALLPGISRSGTTITTGMLCKLKRDEAAKFSFLMGTIIIAGAGFLGILKGEIFQTQNGSWLELAIGFIVAAITGYFAIRFLMNFLKKHNFYGFAIYMIIVSLVSLVLGLI